MAMESNRSRIWALLVAVVGIGAAYALLIGKPGPTPRELADAPPPVVDIVVAAPVTRGLDVQTQGTVSPRRQISLIAQVGGRVESVDPRFAVGEFFATDDELVKLEGVDYRLAIARAESQVAAAQQQLAEEEGRALQAQREWRDLGTEQGNALFLRKPQLAAAKAALSAAEADLAAARLDLNRTSLKAPFNGRITEKSVDVGQFVTPGTPIAGLYSTDAVEIRLPLTDRQIALLDLPLHYADEPDARSGAAAVVLHTRFAGKLWQWRGQLVRTDANIDVNSRVVYAVVEVADPFSREAGSNRPPLAPGLFVNATINGKEFPNITRLPRSALRTDGSVMVVDSEQLAQSRAVNLLSSTTHEIWVQGLQAGERVIVREPQPTLVGTLVHVNDLGEFAGTTQP
ncbi:MAG: efflux RND transporter periplasmic adaptor subunit [Pseudomonadota bacterium]